MGDKTKIEWTEATWNPIRARSRATGKTGWWCWKIAPECANCYAAKQNVMGGTNPGRMGNGVPYALDKLKDVELYLDRDVLAQPLSWKRPRMIFPCSMTDMYGDFVPDAWLDEIHAIIWRTPQHTYQILTKRPGRRRDYLRSGELALSNKWEGVSAGTRKCFEEYVPILRETPAAMRWISIEPLLEPLGDVRRHLEDLAMPPPGNYDGIARTRRIDWVVVGGESGRGCRPMSPQWARELRDQCRECNVPFFMKQMGGYPDKHGVIPDDLNVREYPETRA